MGRYLSGRTTHKVGQVIYSWFTSPDGRGVSDDELFNVDTPYWEIKPVREALTAFAAQASSEFLGKEARHVVHKSSGLHAHVSSAPTEGDDGEVDWSDLGDAIRTARESLQSVQRLGFHFMKVIAEPTPRSHQGVVIIRKSRPRDNASCLKCNLKYI